MMKFDEYQQPAKMIAIHYAIQLQSSLAQDILEGKKQLTSKEEAVEITHFFWDMVDCAVEDENNDMVIAGEVDMQHWMEKLMNIFIGYCRKMGFEDQWTDESNKINS